MPRASRRAAAARAARRGVTLLELLVVLSIMALVAALVDADVRRRRVDHRAARAPARQLAAGLRLARSEALAHAARDVRSCSTSSGGRFRVDRDPREHALPRDVELKLFTAQSDLVDEKVGAIRFFPDGGRNGGRVTIAAGERKYEVDVDWLTGRVAILD